MDIDPELLRRYWLDDCTDAERRRVAAWLEAGEPQREYPIGDELDAGTLEQELWASVAPTSLASPAKAPLSRRRSWVISGIAASLVLVTLVGYLLFWRMNSYRETPLVEYRTSTAPFGRQLTVTLSDSTVVHLNAGSSLRYPERFDGPVRGVVLEGEGFFQVAKNPDRPFIVETPHSITEVLGTRFNLRDFAGETQQSIVVEEGTVRYTGRGGVDTVILQAQERAVYTDNRLEKTHVSSANYTDWKEGVLRFADIPLAEAIPLLERWYGTAVRLDDPSLGSLHIKGSFRDAALTAVMDDLAYLLNLRYRIENNQFILYRPSK